MARNSLNEEQSGTATIQRRFLEVALNGWIEAGRRFEPLYARLTEENEAVGNYLRASVNRVACRTEYEVDGRSLVLLLAGIPVMLKPGSKPISRDTWATATEILVNGLGAMWADQALQVDALGCPCAFDSVVPLSPTDLRRAMSDIFLHHAADIFAPLSPHSEVLPQGCEIAVIPLVVAVEPSKAAQFETTALRLGMGPGKYATLKNRVESCLEAAGTPAPMMLTPMFWPQMAPMVASLAFKRRLVGLVQSSGVKAGWVFTVKGASTAIVNFKARVAESMSFPAELAPDLANLIVVACRSAGIVEPIIKIAE